MNLSPSLRILIVEDEILIALELENLLQDEGHDPIGIAASLPEALAIAEDTQPDIAFVDVHLADGPTGLEIARRLAEDGRTAVLFTTANAKRIPDHFEGAWGVIAKPYSERTLRGALAFVAGCLAGEEVEHPPEGIVLAPDFCQRLAETDRRGMTVRGGALRHIGMQARR